MRRWDRLWTTKDHQIFLQMRAEKRPRIEIARALNRTIHAIASHLTDHNRRHRAGQAMARYMLKPEAPTQQITITHSEVPEWYELGWRFVGFKGDLCVFEWQSEREARWLEQMRAAA